MSEPTLDKLTFKLYTEDGVDYYSVSAVEGATGDCVVPATYEGLVVKTIGNLDGFTTIEFEEGCQIEKLYESHFSYGTNTSLHSRCHCVPDNGSPSRLAIT